MTNANDNTLDRMSHSEAVAEALLFAAGSPVETEDMAVVLKLKNSEVESLMEKLGRYYENHNSGLVIKKIRNSYQLASRPELHDELKVHFEQVTNAPLSRAALEALTIIAYNQPITRGGVEIIRGVNSDSVLSTLFERGLICEKGKSESPGRPVLYGTTDLFLKSAGLESVDQLREIIPPSDIELPQNAAPEADGPSPTQEETDENGTENGSGFISENVSEIVSGDGSAGFDTAGEI